MRRNMVRLVCYGNPVRKPVSGTRYLGVFRASGVNDDYTDELEFVHEVSDPDRPGESQRWFKSIDSRTGEPY